MDNLTMKGSTNIQSLIHGHSAYGPAFGMKSVTRIDLRRTFSGRRERRAIPPPTLDRFRAGVAGAGPASVGHWTSEPSGQWSDLC